MFEDVFSIPGMSEQIIQYLRNKDKMSLSIVNKEFCKNTIYDKNFTKKGSIEFIKSFEKLNENEKHELKKYKISLKLNQFSDIFNNYCSLIHTLDLFNSGITDVSALGKVHTLNLSHCQGITDVSALGKVHNLNLSHCKGITDVSVLRKVHTLNLYKCKGITDVSALGGVHTLNLSHCQGITDVSALSKVHTLDLSNCQGITDVSALVGVHHLDLYNCEGIRDVSSLYGVHLVF